jgi:membrane associated rhomboid family serine protease
MDWETASKIYATLALIAVNVYVHLAPYADLLGFDLKNHSAICLQPAKIVSALQGGNVLLNRLLLSSIVHGDDMHLYYNMISLF